MIGKAMRFATVCTLAFAICGKASRSEVASVSKGTTEDLEPSKTSSCSRVLRLAVLLVVADALEDRPFQSNTAFAPTPQVFPHDIKLDATRQGEEALALNKITEYSPLLALKPLDDPTPADVLAFSLLNKQKDCRVSNQPLGYTATYWRTAPQFNVLEEYTSQAKGEVAEGLLLSPEERAALWGYKNKDKNLINHIARGADKVVFEDSYNNIGIACTLTKKDMLPWLKFLTAGLNKMPSAAAVRLYRGVGFNANGLAGGIAPITGFSSFSEDFNVAKCVAEQKRKDGIQPTIFVMDEHSGGHQTVLDPVWESRLDKEVVFPVGTKFVIVEDSKVQREVVALWRMQLGAGTASVRRTAEGTPLGYPSSPWTPFSMFAKPDFKVLVVKEDPSESELARRFKMGK